MKRAALLLPLALLLACDSKSNNSAAPTAQAKTESPAFTLSAKAITDEYKRNEVAADEKYKGKVVQISGTIGEIGKNAFDQMSVSVKADADGFSDLMAAFDDEQKSQLLPLKTGQSIKLQGEVTGFILGSVALSGCKIVP